MWKNSRLKQDNSKEEAGSSNIPLEKSAEKNVEQVKEKLGSSADLIDRFIKHNGNKYALQWYI